MGTSLIFDGYNLGNDLHITAKPRRPLLAENEITANDYVGADGSDFRGSRLTARTIEVDVMLIADDKTRKLRHYSLERKRRQIAYRLHKTKPCPLILPTSPDIYDLAMLDGSTDLENLSYTDSTTLIFRVFSPASYGKTKTYESLTGQHDFSVGGTYKTEPTIIVQAQNAFSMTIDGSQFVVDGSPGGLCIIGDHRVLNANGDPIRYELMSDLPEWEPGRHSITCSLPYSVEWQERWL